nr:Rv3654c family TadE-like protein [Ornithinimicrobium sp. HY1745]
MVRGLSSQVRGRDGERGSATVLGLGAILLMLAVLIGFLVLGAAVRGSLQARAAADAAALAGAGVLLEGGDEATACGAAGDLAAANGADLLRCEPAAGTTETVTARLQVEVALTVTGLPGLRAHAVAHAGAVPSDDRYDK